MVHYSDQFQVRIRAKGERDLFPCQKRINKMAASRIFYGDHLLQSRLFLFHGLRIWLGWQNSCSCVSITLKPPRNSSILSSYFVLWAIERKHPQAQLRLYIFFPSHGSSSSDRKVNRLLLRTNKQIRSSKNNPIGREEPMENLPSFGCCFVFIRPNFIFSFQQRELENIKIQRVQSSWPSVSAIAYF